VRLAPSATSIISSTTGNARPGWAEQLIEIVEAFGILEAHDAPSVRDGPVVAFAPKQSAWPTPARRWRCVHPVALPLRPRFRAEVDHEGAAGGQRGWLLGVPTHRAATV